MEVVGVNEFRKEIEGNRNSPIMPAMFIGHGNPMNAIEENPFVDRLREIGRRFQGDARPAAILVVSAHWLTMGTFVSTSSKPRTIHDFGGFPQELFAVQYPAPGAPELARETLKLVPHGTEDHSYGLDHGAWTVLCHMFPDADVPVYQLSIDLHQSFETHFELAQYLKALRSKGVLIIGSGNLVHNLRMSFASIERFGMNYQFDWAIEFDEWVKQRLIQADFQPLIKPEQFGQSAALSIPTPDHYIPMLYTLGLAGESEQVEQFYEEVTMGGISMRSFLVA